MVRAEAAEGLRLLNHAVTWLDVFTSEPLTGNGLAVVHDADDIDDRTMRAFARETRLSETTFVQTATVDGADYRNRIFTTLEEVPFAGHPSLGTAVAVAHARGLESATFQQQTRAGVQRVELRLDGLAAAVSMLQAPAELGSPMAMGPALAALSLVAEDAHPELPVLTGSTGLRHLLVPLRDERALASARPDLDAHRALTSATGAVVIYAFVIGTGGAIEARGFFDAGPGIAEDPATGSAAGPLAAYMKQHAGAHAIEIVQGRLMGRPSTLRAVAGEDGITVGGEAVIVLEGTLSL